MFSVYPTLTMAKLFSKYAKYRELDEAKLRCEFDGWELWPQQTVESIPIPDGGVVDVVSTE